MAKLNMEESCQPEKIELEGGKGKDGFTPSE